jgi:hypothetical protein
VNIEGAVSNKGIVAVFDILGLKIYETRLENANHNVLDLPATVTGVYMVKVTDGTKVATKKVVF